MRNRGLLQSIDRHLDQADVRWASIDRHMARSDERWVSIDEEIRLTREEIRLTREEIRLSREQRDRHAEMLDRHAEMFDRHAEMFDRHAEQADRHAEQADRHAEQADRHAEIFADVRVFTRDLMVRMERLTREQVKAMRDLHEESVAHRQALLRVLDRLGPGDSSTAA